MRLLTISFFVILYFVITNIQCAEKTIILKNIENTTSFFERDNFSQHHQYEKRSISSSASSSASLEKLFNFAPENSANNGKNCLENVEKCRTEDKNFYSTSNQISNFIFSSQPPLDFSQMRGVSRSCQKDSRKFINDLKLFKFWALKMYDSSAKIPSGILNGNVNQLGDFDQCLSASSEDDSIKGKYCLAAFEIRKPIISPYLAGLHKLFQSHYHFKSDLEDPGHRVPRFSSINWAICVPNSCSSEDVALGLEAALEPITNATELKIRIDVKRSMCRTINDQEEIPLSTKITIFIFISFIIFELFAALYDYIALGEKNQWIISFSLMKNFNSLTTLTKPPGDIKAIHGIRMMNAVLLVLAHKSMAVFFIPYANRTEAVEYLARPFTVIGRAASLYTDPFITISGLLTSYSLIGKLEKVGRINILEEYISRLYRIIPTFAALIAFCTFILPWLNDGPMWNLVITHHSEICKKYWWRNMLFIHNYFGFKDMCLTHTHHLGIDTELFFVAPFLVYALWKWPKKGAFFLIFLALLATLARYYVTYRMQLSNYVHFGTSVKQLFNTADNMYILPPHRLTVYIMGIFMGYILRKFENVNLTKSQLRIGNTLAFFSFLISYLGPAFMGDISYIYNPTDAALYAAFSPILWVASFCWIIYTTQLGYTGQLGQLLSHPICKFWTKISYTIYLTQFPVFFYNVGVTRSSHEFGFFTQMMNLQEFSWILFLSVALTLIFEMPFQNLRNLMLKKTNSDKRKENLKKLN